MKVALGSDHGGFLLKEEIKKYLESLKITVEDVGTFTSERCDYPDFAHKVARLVLNGECKYGILVCYTGIGMSITANRYKGIRASLVRSADEAYLTRLHNDSNVLCLGGKYTDSLTAKAIIDTYLITDFEGGRHLNRIKKIEGEEVCTKGN